MKRIFIIGLVLTGLLFSCSKEDNNKDTQLKDDGLESPIKERCLEMVYPLTFIMPDGTTITGNNRKEIGIAIKSWHEANPDYVERAALQYPVEAVFKGRPMTINDNQQMQRLKKACAEGKRPCFHFVYPITYIMPDGTTITGNNRKEIGIAKRSWYAANPGTEERPVLQYPVDIKFRDGTIVTINNDEELQSAREDCE